MKKYFFITIIILLSVPFAFYVCNWQWHGANSLSYKTTYFLWLVTETGSFPYAIISSISLGALLWYLLGRKKKTILLILFSIALTQITMTSIKHFFASPRPFITVINNHNENTIKLFYAADQSQREKIINQYYDNQPTSLIFLQNHHLKNAKYSLYSFPSGHTIFVASWALLFAGLLTRRRGKIISLAVSSWAALVMASRVWLGMHYPIDLLASVFLASVINYLLLKYFWRENF